MKEIRDQLLESQTIMVDNTMFINCTIKGCTLIYSGGDFGWVDSRLETNMLRIEGSAYRTMQYLNSFGVLKEQFSKDMNLTPTPDPQLKSLLDEVEKSRATLLKIRSSLGLRSDIAHIIDNYFTSQSAGRSIGEAKG